MKVTTRVNIEEYTFKYNFAQKHQGLKAQIN